MTRPIPRIQTPHHPGSLHLRGTAITALPDGLSVGRSLYLRDTAITALPDGLSVGGGIYAEPSVLPELPDGEIEGWKKCQDGKIVHLSIPADAQRCGEGRSKCRASKVRTISVEGGGDAISFHDGTTVYQAGLLTKCDTWNEDPTDECGGGIHFFRTEAHARAYRL